jgi:prepilin-type N-terminal cleavage/methylation domain-containing protein
MWLRHDSDSLEQGVFLANSGRMPRRVHRGFTLMEMMVVIAIVGVMAALSVAALNGLKSRGNFVSSTGDLVEGVRRTRAEAFSRGSPCVFVIDTAGNRWWSIVDFALAFNLTTFDPNNPAPAPDILLASGTLASKVAFGPSGTPGGYGAALPAPFAGVPSTSSSSPAPAFPYCSFCSTGAPAGYGAITFYGTGGAIFSGGPSAIGQQFTIQAPQPNGQGFQVMTVAVVGKTGAVAQFETSR